MLTNNYDQISGLDFQEKPRGPLVSKLSVLVTSKSISISAAWKVKSLRLVKKKKMVALTTLAVATMSSKYYYCTLFNKMTHTFFKSSRLRRPLDEEFVGGLSLVLDLVSLLLGTGR